MIKIGDRVKFISDTYVGVVTSIKGSLADVEVEDGFVVPAMINDLVAVNKEDEMEAMRRIGVSDERPGTGKGSTQKREKKKVVRREGAYAKYGKVSIVDDAEDDEEILDVNYLRSLYARSVAAINEKELQEHNKEQQESVKWEEASQDTSEEQVSEAPVVHKMERVSVENLDKALGVEIPKEEPKKSNYNSKKSDEEVVDLHASEILDSTDGMTSGEILNAQLSRFDIAMSLAVKSGKHGRIVFVHGVGSGKLKYELQKALKRDYPKLAYQDASFKEYGYGAIMIFY